MRSYMVSLLKAYYGDAATAENDFCFDHLPRLTGDHSTYETVVAQMDGTCKGYFLMGENPAVGSANAKMQRLGMANLDWLVVWDFSLIESATWWKDGRPAPGPARRPREAKSLLETGEILRPDEPTAHDTPGGKVIGLLSRRARGEGVL